MSPQLNGLWFAALVVTPALHAELAARAQSLARARLVSVLGLAVTLLLVAGLSGRFLGDSGQPLYGALPLPLGLQLRFAVDSLNATLLPLAGLLTLAIVAAAPAQHLQRGKLRALLWLESFSLLALSAADLLPLAAGFLLVLLPTRRLVSKSRTGVQRGDVSRVFRVYHLLSVACLSVALLLLALYGSPSLSLFEPDVLHQQVARVPEHVRPLLFGLFTVAACVRMGVTPFHAWLPATLEHGSLLSVTFLVSIRTGLYLIARVAISAFPSALPMTMPVLTGVALFSALYGALAALAQHQLRRMVGFLVVSQSGLMLSGIAMGDEHAIAGALLYWLSFAVAITGLVLLISALEARTGSSDVAQLSGLAGRVPHLSAFLFLFGLATIAIPGTLAFAAEDMLVHGLLEAHPLLTVLMILATVLNAITVVRAASRGLFGSDTKSVPSSATLEDLLPRERAVALSMLLALVLCGLYPQGLLSAQASAANHIAQLVSTRPR